MLEVTLIVNARNFEFCCQLILQKWYEELTRAEPCGPLSALDPPRTALKCSRIRPGPDAQEIVEDAAGVPQLGEDLQRVVPHHVGGGRVEVVPVIVDPVLRREVHCLGFESRC